MPLYQYVCPQNGKTIEVRHGMNQTLKTWGELCTLAQVKPGRTSLKAKVERVIFGGMVMIKGKKSPGSGCSSKGSCSGSCSCCGH